jgi:hypothetical protein
LARARTGHGNRRIGIICVEFLPTIDELFQLPLLDFVGY